MCFTLFAVVVAFICMCFQAVEERLPLIPDHVPTALNPTYTPQVIISDPRGDML
jgi:hypothetical protein